MKNTILNTSLVSVIVSISAFLILNYFMGNFENKKVASLNVSEEYTLLAGVIRNEGSGWGLIQDETHETIGIKSVEQTKDMIIVKYDKKSKINSVSVSVDETMAKEGYSVGASVSDAEMRIQVFDKDDRLINPNDYQDDKGNIWISGIYKK